MSFLDILIRGFINVFLPGKVCPIIVKAAGPGCCQLKAAILMNESLLDAYRKGAESEGLWDYESVKSAAKEYPDAKKFVDGDIVMTWLRERGHYDVLRTIESTPGGKAWFDRQIEDFKHDLFGA